MFIHDKLDVSTISFGYPDPSKMNASIMSPVLARTHLGLHSCLGVVEIIDSIKKFIEPYGDIMLNTSVLSLDPIVLSRGRVLNVENVIITSPVHLQHEIVSFGPTSYTKLYAVIIELSDEPTSFLDGHNRCLKDVCVLYLINYNNHGVLKNFNCTDSGKLKIVGLSDKFHRPLSEERTISTVSEYFGSSLVKIHKIVDYPNTMPIIHPSDINKLQNNQGIVRNNVKYYFAGQYLGYPSVEVACYTGRLAGKKIADPDNVNSFKKTYDELDQILIDEFNDTVGSFKTIFMLMMIILFIIIAYSFGIASNNSPQWRDTIKLFD